MEPAGLPAELLADCHHLGSLPATQVLLNRNSHIPWFILVPDTLFKDILDLPDEHREAVLADCAAVSAFIKQVLGFDKVNFAGLGNVVADMHLHVIGRHPQDPCWPQPVWGNLPHSEAYQSELLREWQAGMAKMIGLAPVAL
jgi:diadenosine tetraphosphate (Ap4A) HIT family hydrolase